jgi:hypothetical protein
VNRETRAAAIVTQQAAQNSAEAMLPMLHLANQPRNVCLRRLTLGIARLPLHIVFAPPNTVA